MPLCNLERKDTPFQWTAKCQQSFNDIKERLTSAPILAHPRFDQPFILDMDACEVGLGAVLTQVQAGAERVIGYAARALSKPERNYSTTRKELLAMVWGMEHFEPFLLGKGFTVRSDHRALKWLRNFKKPKGQVARWLETLAEFDFTINHRPSTKTPRKR